MRICQNIFSALASLGIFMGLVSCCCESQGVAAAYLESVKNNETLLRQFFAEMPKGGDIHNHLTGSVYAETYYDLACKDSLWVDTISGRLYDKTTVDTLSLFRLLPKYIDSKHALKVSLIDKWSIRNFQFYTRNIPPDEHFFNTFGLFSAATNNHMVELINELKKRALHENVQYLELMAASPSVSEKIINDIMTDTAFYKTANTQLLEAIKSADTSKIHSVIKNIVVKMDSMPAWKAAGINYGKYIDSLDNKTSIKDDKNLVTRYQAYASRNSDPMKVLAQLHIGFIASNDSTNKVVGVNIVSAENSEISIAHYTAHMLMFSELSNYYSTVKKSLHAGELTLGLVKPEELSNHIYQAVKIAKANRIGHGVDIAFEDSCSSLLKFMSVNQIAVEINLTSNEFILGVKDNEHPFSIYNRKIDGFNKVPMVISTDDPGILRTNLAEQYVLLVRRYGLDYAAIKQIVNNSIDYSFLEQRTKDSVKTLLGQKFETFEKKNWQ